MVQTGIMIHTIAMEDTVVTATMVIVVITDMVHQLMIQQAIAEEQAMKDQIATQALEVMEVITTIEATHHIDMMLMGITTAITGT